jgi:hypothetical protein
MNRFATLGLGAVAVVAIVLIGSQVFSSPSGRLGSQQQSATPSPSPSPTARPTPSPTTAPPLTQSFTSTRHGITVSYPKGWTAQAATKPWSDSTFPLNFPLAQADWLYDPTLTSNLFLTIASQPIGDSTPEAWVARQMGSGEGCPATEPITVSNATGLIGTGECNVVVVTTSGRGYWIQLYTSGDQAWLASAYNRAWFEEFLATVRLHPKDAVN